MDTHNPQADGAARQIYPHGGLVTGPGTATSDDVPSRIPRGSFVLNADAVEIAGIAFLETLNTAGDILQDVELSNGEFIMQPAAVAAIGEPFLQKLNATGLLQRACTLGEPSRLLAQTAVFQAACAVSSEAFEVRVVTPALAGGGMLGVALGAGVDQWNKLREQDRQDNQDKRAAEYLDIQKGQAAQQAALGVSRIYEAQQKQEEDAKIREHLANTRDGWQKIQKGDYSPLAEKAAAYSSQAPGLNNGYTAKINPDNGSVEHYNPNGELVDSLKLNRDTAGQLYMRAAGEEMRFLSPKFYDAAERKAADLEKVRQESEGKKDVARIYANSRENVAETRADASTYGADTRADAWKYSADHRPTARSGPTTAQDRGNIEIDAARKVVEGLSPEDIRRKTAKTTNTGRENPDFDPGLERAARLASRRKIGADDWFDQRNGTTDAMQGGAAQATNVGDSWSALHTQPGAQATPTGEVPRAPVGDRADIAKRFRAEGAMANYTLGRDTPRGVEVLDKGRVIGHYR